MKPNALTIITHEGYKSQIETIFDNLDVKETTRQDYKYRIKLFLDFVQQNGFNRNSFLNFKRWLAGENNWSVATKNKYLIAAKIFLQELNRIGLTDANITQNIKTFTQSKKHKRSGLNDDEMQRLVGWLQNLTSTPSNIRLKAIISLLALQGLRQIEICRLDVKDLDLAGMTASITSKGMDDTELINLHPETVRALAQYLKTNTVADGPLFVSRSNSSQNHRLTTRGLRQIVKQILTNLGIDKVVHGFRHYFTSTLINTYKGDLLEVAQLTRHKSLEMLQVYNDNIRRKADLPRYYKAFDSLEF